MLLVVAGVWCAGAVSVDGQRMDARVKALVANGATGALKKAVVDESVGVVIRGAASAVRAAVAEAGGTVGVQVGDLTTATVPVDGLRRLTASPVVERIELRARPKPHNDLATRDLGAGLVQTGTSPLTGPLDGGGVLVGVVDSGVDYRHLDFRDPGDPSKSRIHAIWDQEDNGPGPIPAGFAFGTVWSRSDIEGAIAGSGTVRHEDSDGHGTHVSGSAVGNGAASGGFGGVAPQADLVVAASFRFLTEAMAWMFAQADSLGVPAVVNYSGGSHVGPHDGESLEEQMIDAMLEEKPGRALVTSAGNEGLDFIHWGGFDLEADSLWTYYHLNLFDPEAIHQGAGFFSLSGSVDGDLANTFVAIGLDSTAYVDFFVERRGFHGMTPWTSLQALVDAQGLVTHELTYRDGSRAGSVELVAELTENGKADLSVFVTDDLVAVDLNDPVSAVGADLFRFMIKGSGTLHVWSEFVLSAESADVQMTVPDDRYVPTDNRLSVGVPASSKQAIAVGAYVNSAGFGSPAVVGALSGFSSRGPTADGRVKPEIIAPGEGVTSALSQFTPAALLGDPTSDGLHVMSSGTSFSAPLVAGAVALFLQHRPEATVDEIRDAFTTHAREDAFTGSSGALPNNDWGHGKLDVFAALTAGLGITPSASAPETITLGATIDGELGLGNAQDVYTFTVGSPTDVRISLVSDYDAILAVYRTGDVSRLNDATRITAQDFSFDEESVSLRLSPESYAIVVTPLSPFDLGRHTVSLVERQVTRTVSSVALGEKVSGTIDSGDGEAVFVLALAGQADLEVVLDPTFDGVLALHRGTTIADILPDTEVRRVDASLTQETIRETVEAGSYLVLVHPFDGGTGTFTLTVGGTLRTPVGSGSDFNGDGAVDFADFLTFAGGFGKAEGEAGYDGRLDLDGDGAVGFADFLVFAGAFGG